MNSRLSCNPEPLRRASSSRTILPFLSLLVLSFLAAVPKAVAGDAPGWMHALTSVPLPAHDEKTDAILLYEERITNVQSADKVKEVVRRAYKILRPGGRDLGIVGVSFNAHEKITALRGWCIPAQGKDYEVKDKEAVEIAIPKVDGSELVSDVRFKVLRIPASDPGNIVGYEYEIDNQPYILQQVWSFQESNPVRESRFTLQLPAGWEYKASWLNYSKIEPTPSGNNQWQWIVTDVKPIKSESNMPPITGLGGQMIVSFLPPGGTQKKGFQSWQDMGLWYRDLVSGRRDATPEIKQKVAELTGSAAAPLDKMQALARFVQHDIRYVAIELGIGGWQPHPASEVFTHRYGDCKDKATLMGSMLHEIGIDSFYVVINSERDSVTPEMPPHMGGFDHVITAIRLPDSVSDKSLIATMQHPKLGKILFFDPTDDLTPFGTLYGPLQANYGLLVTPDGGELTQLPKLESETTGVHRKAKLKIDAKGTLDGQFSEVRTGDRASEQRAILKNVTSERAKIQPIETLLSHSLTTFQITRASVTSLNQTNQPFGYEYTVVAPNYGRLAGNLLLVRPRVIGNKGSDILETKEPRKYAIEFEGPSRDSDNFEITLPPGYTVDPEDLPPPVDVDYGFASYHSKTELAGNVLRYTRTYEVKDVSVPLEKMEQLKKLYRVIASDERNTAVLKPAGTK